MAPSENSKNQFDPVFFRYYVDLSRVEVLDPETEKTLFQRYKNNGDLEARDRLLKSCLRFVVKLAKSYSYGIDHTKELISAGNLGLMCALEHYDPTKGTRFLSYATYWVMLHIHNERAKRWLVSTPRWRQKALRQVKNAQRKLLLKTGKATQEDILAETPLSEKQLKRLRDTTRFYVYYDDTETNPHLEAISTDNIDETVIANNAKDVVRELMETLNGKEKFIVKNYFGIGVDKRSLRQIADILGITPERVRQVKLMAIKQMRHTARVSKNVSETSAVVP